MNLYLPYGRLSCIAGTKILVLQNIIKPFFAPHFSGKCDSNDRLLNIHNTLLLRFGKEAEV